MSLSREEWIRRYKKTFKDRANLSDEEAQACVDAVTFEEASAHFEDNPEGAALEEMSYWD